MNENNRQKLLLLRKAIPFLQEIPDSMYFLLKAEDYVIPIREVAIARQELENIFAQHVMTYNKSLFSLDIPLEAHLCALVKQADLSEKQKIVLHEYEKRFAKDNVTFVVYQKPLQFQNIFESAVGKYYIDQHLL